MKNTASGPIVEPPPAKPKAATIRDVAHAVGVSKMTVSFVINGTGRVSPETRQAVLRAADELGFRPNPHAQHLSRGRGDRTVGYFALGLDLGAGIRKAQLIQRAIMERGYEAPLYGYSIYDHDERGERQIELMKTLCRQRPRAIVCNTSALHSGVVDELCRYRDDGGIVVLYDERVDMEADCVVFDREMNTYRAACHLIELGHREIGLAGCNLDLPPCSRLEGFRRALREAGLPERSEFRFLDLPPYEEGGAQLAERFAALPERPTALCVVNDSLAATFILEAHRRSVRVPDDVSVVSLDDLAAARYAAVPLTAVSQPIQAISDAVVDLLISRLEGGYDGEPRRIVVRGELVSRQSTAPATAPM